MVAAKPFFDVDFRPGVIPPWRQDLAAEQTRRRFGITDPSMTAREARLFGWLACWRGAQQAETVGEYQWWVNLAATVESGVGTLGAAEWGLRTMDASYALGDLVGAICKSIQATMPEKLKPENGE